MEADPRQILYAANKAGELVGKAERLMWLAIGAGTHKGFAALPDAEHKQSLSLSALEPAQVLDCVRGQGDDAVSARLWRLKSDAGFDLLKALHDAKRAAIEIDVLPTHGENLAPGAFRSTKPAAPANRPDYGR